jgi:hypothetical protein
MRLTPLCAVTLALSLCGTAAAQVGTLVRHDTSNDPCKKFKMRVLMPADVGTKPRPESPVGPPDAGIVWNPCQGDVIQYAGMQVIIPMEEQVIPTPGGGTLPAVPPSMPSFKLQPPTPRSERLTVLGVQLRPAFEFTRRHQ